MAASDILKTAREHNLPVCPAHDAIRQPRVDGKLLRDRHVVAHRRQRAMRGHAIDKESLNAIRRARRGGQFRQRQRVFVKFIDIRHRTTTRAGLRSGAP
jgi:hypothetical protein